MSPWPSRPIPVSLFFSVSLSLSIPPYLSTYLSVCPSIYLSRYISISLFLSLSLSVSPSPSLTLSQTLSQLPKLVRDRQVSTLLACECASCHRGLPLFHISTSKSGPRPSVLNTIDLRTCFAPQRCAPFEYLNVQKEKVLRWIPHPAALAGLLFDPPEPPNIGKTQCFTTFLPFRALWSYFFWLFLFSDFFSSDSFSSLSLPTCAASCVHIVGNLTSKLPSVI